MNNEDAAHDHPNLQNICLTIRFIPKAVCDDVTESPELGKPAYAGAARQFGSGKLRNPDDGTFNKIHHEKQEKMRERDERERFRFEESSASIGVLVSHPKPPGYNTRYVGKTPIAPHHFGISHDVFRPLAPGTRRDDMFIHQGLSPSHDKVFFDHDEGIIMGEGALEEGGHQNAGGGLECDATCEAMEFFCSKSCSCIHSDLHCGTKRDDLF